MKISDRTVTYAIMGCMLAVLMGALFACGGDLEPSPSTLPVTVASPQPSVQTDLFEQTFPGFHCEGRIYDTFIGQSIEMDCEPVK